MDSSGAYAEAIRRALPGALQVGDRWHIWHDLADAVLKEIAAHSACWAKAGLPPQDGKRAATTRERWQQVHDLLGKPLHHPWPRRSDRPAVSPKRLARYLLTRPGQLSEHQRELLDTLATAFPEMTAVAGLVRSFAVLLTPSGDNAELLAAWIDDTRAEDLPHLHAFTRGLDQDRSAVNVAVTCIYHNGGKKGVRLGCWRYGRVTAIDVAAARRPP